MPGCAGWKKKSMRRSAGQLHRLAVALARARLRHLVRCGLAHGLGWRRSEYHHRLTRFEGRTDRHLVPLRHFVGADMVTRGNAGDGLVFPGLERAAPRADLTRQSELALLCNVHGDVGLLARRARHQQRGAGLDHHALRNLVIGDEAALGAVLVLRERGDKLRLQPVSREWRAGLFIGACSCAGILIGASFTGRAEGRDALFRAGITILEKAQRTEESAAREALFDLARHEFQKLRHTPGAPLEYLGKALAYQHSGEYDEEVKCLELAFRRYKNHPLLRVLVEHVVLRMHESSRQDRVAAYQFICFVLRFLPDVAAKPSSQKLLHSLNSNWEVPPFFLSNADEGEPINRQHHFCLILAFWLEKSYVASEIFEELIATPVLPISHIVDCLLLFIALGQFDLLRDGLSRWRQLLCEEERTKYAPLFRLLSLFFLDGKDFAGIVKLNNAVAFGVCDPIAENRCAIFVTDGFF